jgi:hypothetical protein
MNAAVIGRLARKCAFFRHVGTNLSSYSFNDPEDCLSSNTYRESPSFLGESAGLLIYN